MTPLTATHTAVNRVILWLCFAFLYLPMLLVVIYSFNSSPLVTVWHGFSFTWYHTLLKDSVILSALGLSLLVATLAATMALILGTLAAIALTRLGHFYAKTGFHFMLTAPLVMPDIITGLALLLLFIAMENLFGWPTNRGIVTLWLAHTTFCTAYVAVVVSARLREIDRTIEEAALDLGATPMKVFFVITVPAIAPALCTGWLLAFTLSLDDLVVASFVTGPGATTLPMTIFATVRRGINPEINALATLIIFVVSLVGWVVWRCMARAERRRRLRHQPN